MTSVQWAYYLYFCQNRGR